MNEENKIKEKYFNDTTYLGYLNVEQKKLNNITNILNTIEQYGDKNKGPDLVSKYNNKIYGIEHFEFDSSKNDRKGSRYKQQIGIIDNSMNKEIRYKKKVHNLSVLALNQNIETYILLFTIYALLDYCKPQQESESGSRTRISRLAVYTKCRSRRL